MEIRGFFEIVISSKDLIELANNIEQLVLLFDKAQCCYKQKTMSELYDALFARVFFAKYGFGQIKIYSAEESVIEYFYNYWEFATTFRGNIEHLQAVVVRIRNEMLPPKTAGLSKETIQALVTLTEHKFQYVTKVLKEQPLKILQFDYSHMDFNCYYTATILEKRITKDYVIMTCPHKQETHQEFGFVHELGHKLHTLLANKLFTPPTSFKCFDFLYDDVDKKNNNIMAEHFADSFAIAVLSNSPYEHCIPFEVAPENVQLFTAYFLITIVTMNENAVDSITELTEVIKRLQNTPKSVI